MQGSNVSELPKEKLQEEAILDGQALDSAQPQLLVGLVGKGQVGYRTSTLLCGGCWSWWSLDGESAAADATLEEPQMELQSLQSKGEPTVEPAGLIHSNPSCFRNIAFNAFDAFDASWNLGRSAGICPGRCRWHCTQI